MAPELISILLDGDNSSSNSISSILTAAAAFVTAICGGAATLIAALRAGSRRATRSVREAQDDETPHLNSKEMKKVIAMVRHELEHNDRHDHNDHDDDHHEAQIDEPGPEET